MQIALEEAQVGWSAAAKRSRAKDLVVIESSLELAHARAAVAYLNRVMHEVARIHPGTVGRMKKAVWDISASQAREGRPNAASEIHTPASATKSPLDPRWYASQIAKGIASPMNRTKEPHSPSAGGDEPKSILSPSVSSFRRASMQVAKSGVKSSSSSGDFGSGMSFASTPTSYARDSTGISSGADLQHAASSLVH